MPDLLAQERAAHLAGQKSRHAGSLAKEAKLQAKAAKVQAKQAKLQAKAAKLNAKLMKQQVRTSKAGEDIELAEAGTRRSRWPWSSRVVPVKGSRRARAHDRRLPPKGAAGEAIEE